MRRAPSRSTTGVLAVVLAVVAGLAVVIGGYALVLVPGLVVLIGALLVDQVRRTERRNAALEARLAQRQLLAGRARARVVRQSRPRPPGAHRSPEW